MCVCVSDPSFRSDPAEARMMARAVNESIVEASSAIIIEALAGAVNAASFTYGYTCLLIC